ncbi:MAG TPA: ester cyclase [Candidatus Dormibacteraeota bacterium]|nr:ester cyclase [Candidatus Dormibacteraeota bacterium]HEX2680145.1 ester cyclase [Candidatus Dormibacteraeota bacterium]
MVRSKYKTSELDKVVKDYKETVLPSISTHEGARTAMLLLDRETGDAISVAIYEHEAAAKSFAPKAEKLIDSFKKYLATSTAPRREVFEIATSTQIEARAVIERGIKAFNSHDLEAIARDAAPDIEETAPGDVKLKGPQQGKEFNQNFLNAFPDARSEAKQIITQGNRVVVQGIFTGTHNGTLKTPMGDVPATGRKVKGEYVQIFEVDRGLVKKVDLLYDQVQLMTQLGMAPQAQAVKTAK